MSLPPIFPILSTTPAVTAIVGTSPCRVYPAGNIPQVAGTDPNANIPCVTWQQVGGMPENLLSERAPVDNQRVQIDAWALTFTAANNLAETVRTALELSGYLVSLNGADYDSDTKRYRVSFDFSFWLGRT